MSRRLLIPLFVSLVVGTAAVGSLPAEEIGFVETFALVPDRTTALAQLIPGTEDYYYYHALHYQNTEQFDKADETLKAWIKRHNYTARVREIELRQAVLTYPQNPLEALEYVRNRLGLQFNHQRERLGEKPNLSTALDLKLINRETLTQRAMARAQNLSQFEDSALEWLVEADLNADRRRHLLERLKRPDYPNLVKLVAADLDYRHSRGFGSFEIHRQLLPEQLDALLKLKPELLNQSNFVNAYLAKLHPSADVDWQHNDEAHEAYLDRLWAFVSRLAPVHNSLKANVLYRRLVFDRAQGVYNKDRFMQYIKLPRHVHYIEPKFMQQDENRRHAANLNADLKQVTLLPPVGTDEPLVRSYLFHFFTTENTWSEYADYIDDQYLKHLFAETKIVNGLGEAEQWYSMLPPAMYQNLKERIDLDFAFTNEEVFGPDEPVSLDIYVKNVESLIVKVYQIKTDNYYREKQRPIDTDLNLDGLVAGQEKTYTYDLPPLRRVKRHFDFPELNSRGVYIIDFIGNGRSSRALVRKGRLRFVEQATVAGHLFQILDEENNRLPAATLWLAGHEYQPNEKGQILVPYTNSPGRQAIVLSHDGFSTLAYFEHQAEKYRLTAGIYVDRESLLQRKKAQVLVRPGLTVNGNPVTLKVLEETKLIITSTDLEGVSTVKEVEDFKVFTDRESVHEFSVPARLASIQFQVTAKVERITGNGQKVDVSAAETFALNQIDKTDKTEDMFFAQAGEAYFVDVLGKTGEALTDRPVQFELKHQDFTQPVHVTLQSDPQGRILLGSLPGIEWVRAANSAGTKHQWNLLEWHHTYYSTRQGKAGEPLRIPLPGNGKKPARDAVSLLELRGNTFVSDRFDAMTLQDGYLHVAGLPRGDYSLWLKEQNQEIKIRLSEGIERGDFVLGENRQLEVRGEEPLVIAGIDTGKDQVKVQLSGATQHSRVHVFATRFRPDYNPFVDLSDVRDINPMWRTTPPPESRYIEGRNIGDEYRYIIDRRNAAKFPGNMLRRPSVLLNPWAVRTTQTDTDQAELGGAFGGAGSSREGRAVRAGGGTSASEAHSSFSSLDFLAESSVVMVNLRPDADGAITIERAELGPHQYLHIVAIDPLSTTYLPLTLDEAVNKFVDLRVAEGLDPEQHFTQQKQISVGGGKDPFVLSDVGASRFESYDSLRRVYALMFTLSGDAKLAKFGFILNWPEMTDEEKREKYSEYACHELHLFLYKKDPEFFNAVVRPYLANKKNKQFLDHWLLEEDLSKYTQSWAYGQLNVVEQILLSQRIKGEQQETARNIADLYDLLPPNTEQMNKLFNTAVQSSSLDTDDAFGYADAKAKKNARPALEMPADKLADEHAAGQARGLAKRTAPAPQSEPAAPNSKPGRDPFDAEREEKKQAATERQNAGKDRRRKEEAAKAAPELAEMDALEAADADDFFRDEAKLREQARQFYVKLDKTREWAESHYYHLALDQQKPDLITVNAFWRDYAKHDPQQSFRSTHLAQASRNFPEIMFALAVLDLPFEAPEHKTDFVDAQMTVTAGGPMIVFHEEIRPAEAVAEQTPILVSQNFFRHGDRYRYEQGQRVDKYVTEEYLVETVYGCQVVVTNPTSSQQKLDVLLQVPVGAIPVSGGKYTRSQHLELNPYQTAAIEYFFYFPAAGKFGHYPVQVAKKEESIAFAEPVTLNVVAEPSRIDRESWAYISQHGTDDQVLDYLKSHNLHRTDLSKIAFRMQDKAFFNRVTNLLAARHVYNHTLWSYAVKHNVPAAIAQFLKHDDGFVKQVGTFLNSELVDIDPIERKTYEHLDYRPLVNARAHQLGRERKILNDRFHWQYQRWMELLSYKRSLSDIDLLSTVYYLLLQDRVEEARSMFSKVNAEELDTKLQYDYFASHLDFYTLDHRFARDIAERYRDYPVDKWRELFLTVLSQLDEIDGAPVKVVDDSDRDQKQTGQAAAAANLEFTIESKEIVLNYQGLEKVQVNYYLMDIELLFSRNPFVQEYGGQFAYIQPNRVDTVELPKDQSSLKLPLPQELLNSNVLVEITGGGQSRQQAYYSNSLVVQMIENYGQLRVTHTETGKAAPAVYVKVYARMNDGEVKFYKDGYTDLRGRFDYTSLSTNELENVNTFSLLVLSEEHGAVVREAKPPKE